MPPLPRNSYGELSGELSEVLRQLLGHVSNEHFASQLRAAPTESEAPFNGEGTLQIVVLKVAVTEKVTLSKPLTMVLLQQRPTLI